MSHTRESVPSGLKGHLACVSSGGDTLAWLPSTESKDYTNAFIIHKNKILLGYKKRGFGKNMYNGFGGKVELGETSQQAALRELEEEAGITAPLQHAGTLLFTTGAEEAAYHIEVYRADEYTGDVTETDEMRPEWFSLPLTDSKGSNATEDNLPTIPFEKMWEDDRHWMPLLISRTKFAGRADFKREGDSYTMHKWWFGTFTDS
ncbi:7,8-dihydro-8-oxoguanine triphosphatase [Termitomyces sp. T112]|nr:7,8-dihydro-8-oxoguanine triphosphatase [Termitomyces sp. T112]